jgi:hypothetical protein
MTTGVGPRVITATSPNARHDLEDLPSRGSANPPVDADKLPLFRGLRPLKKWTSPTNRIG